MTVRSTEGRETLLKLALPAPQGSGNAAGRLTRRGRPAAVRQLDDLPGASEAQDPRLASFENDFLRHAQASAFPWRLDRTRFGAKKTLITLKLELPDQAKTLEKKVLRHCAGWGGNSRSLLISFFWVRVWGARETNGLGEPIK